MTDRPSHATLVAAALTLVLALAGCTQPEPTLLDASDVEGVVSSEHDELAQTHVPGALWCERLTADGLTMPTGAISRLNFSETSPYPTAGAAIGDRGMAETVERLEDGETRCAATAEEYPGLSIEPLSGLDADAMGWRLRDDEHEVWGEFAVVPIDSGHVLLAGFETDQDEPPVELDELIRLGLEGAERVGTGD